MTVRCSYLEIYQECLSDLLVDNANEAPLLLRESPEKGVFVENLKVFQVENAESAHRLYLKGSSRRYSIAFQTPFGGFTQQVYFLDSDE